MNVLRVANRGTNPLRQRVAAMVETGVTPSKIAIEAGVRLRDLNAWLEGGPCAEGFEAKLTAWIEDLDRPEGANADPGWIETPTGKRIESALEFARTRPSIVLIYGSPGVSKTTAAEHYAETRRAGFKQSGALYVMAREFSKSPVATLQLLAEKLGRHGSANRSHDLANAILDTLGQGSIIIIDEAQHLSAAALDGLRCFHDEGGIGLAYLGNEFVFTRIAHGGRRARFAQLHSRVGLHLNIPRPEVGDVDAILEAWGVSGREERECAQQIAGDPGGLRVLAHVLRQARLAARAMKRPVDAALMRGALNARGFGE